MTAISTKLFAPQARLVDLATGTVLGATTVSVSGPPGGSREVAVIAPDILSARVTLTNTGIGQLQVTLNNQRFDHTLDPGRPVFPPWKYNDFSQARPGLASTGTGGIRFGQKVRLDLRYGSGSWTKMIVAQITDLQFSFPASGGAQLQIVGEDLLSLLKIKPNADKHYERKHEEDIVQEVLNAVFTAADQRPAFTPDPDARANEGRTQPLRSLRHQKTTTYFQFLTEMADRLDYEMYVEFQELTAAAGDSVGQASSGAIAAGSELKLCFEPARSGNPPEPTEQDGLDQTDGEFHYVLRWGRSLVELNPKFKVFDMPTSAEATGTSHGRRARSSQRLTPSEIDGLFRAELPVSPNYASLAMKTALEARTEYFGAAGVSGENNDSSHGSNLDEPRLKRKAIAGFLKKVREFLTADGKVIGLPRLRPGVHVDIVGFRPPFDGYYYVTRTVHTLDASGYVTQFSLRRPGMLPPENYLDLPAGAESAAPGATP
jgi:hypothetical protein